MMPSKSVLWKTLQQSAETVPRLTTLFANQPERTKNMSYRVGGLYADFSKQCITPEIQTDLFALLASCNFDDWRARFFAGDNVNTTENRPALHPALRGTGGDRHVQKQVRGMQIQTRTFCERIRAEGKYKTIVHIGIGGSDLGPRLCADALSANHSSLLEIRFANNMDGASINDALKGLDPATSLVISVSKSFATQETKMNSVAAKAWLGKYARTNMIAVTANRQSAEEFGISPGKIFDFWDWVGGRYSLWSAVSLSLQIAYGPDVFDALLKGAHAMDIHFQSAPMAKNLPVMLAMTGIWNCNFLGFPTQAIIPYARHLRKFPAFLQQLEMESNGKGVTRDGKPAGITCPVIWGDEGTNSQHAFFQHIHQGNGSTPIDFIAILESSQARPAHQTALLANCFAQSEALMVGKNEDIVRDELIARGMTKAEIDALAPHKTFPGNHPSTTILLEKLDAYTLGNLIALYEHKVFVQSIVWDINPFDQWGVELGKVLAGTILNELKNGTDISVHDSSTQTLITLARAALKP